VHKTGLREQLESYDEDPGWYENPPGNLASLASDLELQRDIGQIPSSNPTENKLKMNHGNMDQIQNGS
jgi:hypothetical protein